MVFTLHNTQFTVGHTCAIPHITFPVSVPSRARLLLWATQRCLTTSRKVLALDFYYLRSQLCPLSCAQVDNTKFTMDCVVPTIHVYEHHENKWRCRDPHQWVPCPQNHLCAGCARACCRVPSSHRKLIPASYVFQLAYSPEACTGCIQKSCLFLGPWGTEANRASAP